MYPLRCYRWKAAFKIEAHLVAEDRYGARTGPVFLPNSLIENPAQQVEIRLHLQPTTAQVLERCAHGAPIDFMVDIS